MVISRKKEAQKKNGSGWDTVNFRPNDNGKLYIAGQVTNASSSANLSYWDGSQWIPWVGVSGDRAKTVMGITVIDSMLYVYGRFNSIAGTNCRGIAACNGTRWYGFGAGLSNSTWETIHNLQKVNGEIYVSGNYSTIEYLGTGIPSQQLYTQLVKLDKNKWCALGPPFGNVATRVVGYKNDLYALGAFTRIGNDTVWGFGRYDGITLWSCGSEFSINASTVGLSEIINFESLKIYPNPVKNKLNIEFDSFETSGFKIEIINPFGQVVNTLSALEHKQEIDLSEFPTGIYFLRIQNLET